MVDDRNTPSSCLTTRSSGGGGGGGEGEGGVGRWWTIEIHRHHA